MKRKFGLVTRFAIFILSLTCLTSSQLCAQTNGQKNQTFGSSLKRPKTNTTDRLNKDADRKTENDASRDIIRVDTSLVLLDVLVTDARGAKPITGLTKDDFVITEDGQRQEISFFAPGDDAQQLPRSIVLIFDRSNSELPYLDASVEAAKKLVNQLAPTDEMAIVTDDIDLAIGFTKDKKQLKRTLDSLKRRTLEGYRTRSMQFSALLATLRELVDVTKRRPIIIFQADGDEIGALSKWPPIAGEQVPEYDYDMNDIYSEVEKSRTKIYTVVPNDKLVGLSEQEATERARLMLEKQRVARARNQDMWYGLKRLPPQANSRPPVAGTSATVFRIPAGGLKKFEEKSTQRAVATFVQGQAAAAKVAELTGGWASFLETPEQAAEIYGRILSDINQRYVIGYYPTNKQLDGTLRSIRIDVLNPEYVIQGRRSYYALPR